MESIPASCPSSRTTTNRRHRFFIIRKVALLMNSLGCTVTGGEDITSSAVSEEGGLCSCGSCESWPPVRALYTKSRSVTIPSGPLFIHDNQRSNYVVPHLSRHFPHGSVRSAGEGRVRHDIIHPGLVEDARALFWADPAQVSPYTRSL